MWGENSSQNLEADFGRTDGGEGLHRVQGSLANRAKDSSEYI